MDSNEKKLDLTDVLGKLSKNKKTDPKATSKTKDLKDVLGALGKEDLTEVEKKIPKFDIPEEPEILNIEAAKNIEVPEIDEDFAIVGDTIPEKPKPQPKPKKPEPLKDKDLGIEYINKIEQLEQKIMKLEEENGKQRALIESQKKEIDEYTSRLGELGSENEKLKMELSSAVGNIQLEFEAQLNRAAVVEEKYDKLAKHHEEVKAKVRHDIRKIQLREKELANKLELMKQDSETLLAAKDHKVLELKKYIDNLEFEIETLKDKIENMRESVKENEEKADRVIKVLRLSTSLLEAKEKKG